MSILDFFQYEMNKTLTVKTLTTTVVNGIVSKTYTNADTKIGMLWTRSAAERYFSQQIKGDVSKYFVTYPSLIITDKDRAEIDGVEYDIESPNNVGEQGEVLLVGLKERT